MTGKLEHRRMWLYTMYNRVSGSVAREGGGGGVATGGVAVNGQIYEVTVPMPGFCFCRSGEAISGNKLVLRSTC